MLFMLIGPFLMFSNLSFIASYNLVTDAAMDFSIKIENFNNSEVYHFPIFSATKPLTVRAINETEFYLNKFDLTPETKFFEYDQVQIVKTKNASETEWTLSNDYV
jgi:hypothetical protein